MKHSTIVAATAFVFGLMGCASVSSKAVDYTDGKARAGLHYSAPKVVFSVELIKFEDDDELTVAISEPLYEGDPNATFTLKASSGLFSDQKYDFRVDPNTRLLDTIRAESEGKLDDIVEDLAGAAGGGKSFDERGGIGGGVVLYSRIIDPMMQSGCDFGQSCQLTELMDDLRTAALPHLDCSYDPEKPLCRALDNGIPLFQVDMTPLFEVGPGLRTSKRVKSCRNSVCYRAPVPYEIRLRIAGVTDISQIVHLPNEGPVLSLKLPAGLFADAKSFVGLIEGMPVLVRTDRGSEAAVAASVPLRATDAFFAGFSKVAQLRINYNTDRTRLDESNNARADFEDEDQRTDDERNKRREEYNAANEDKIESDPGIKVGSRSTDERGGLDEVSEESERQIEPVSTVTTPQRQPKGSGSTSEEGKLLSATISTN